MSDYLGPKINHIEKTITRRDSLGIEGIANTISAQLCPIVNTVTPRPFYWAFITWGYWKQYQITKKENDEEARKLIKRVNYYFAVASHLCNKVQQENNFIGLSVVQSRYWNKSEDFYEYDQKYIVNANGNLDYLSTMAYYPPGVESLYLVVTRDNNGKEYSQHHLTPKGERVALAFEKVMQQTEYGRNCIEAEIVSKEALLELGEKVDIRLTHFDECKKLLTEYLFADNMSYSNLARSKDFIKYIVDKFNLNDINLSVCRDRFFDAFSPRAENNDIADNLLDQAKGWEVVIGRQYFTTGLSVIWTHMQTVLSKPMTKSQWITVCLESGNNAIDMNLKLEQIIPTYQYDSRKLEEAAKLTRPNNSDSKLEQGLIILLSVYNRFNNRTDYTQEQISYLDLGEGTNISLNEFISVVESYKEKRISEFVAYIMSNYLIDQHLKTAFNKMVQGRDGYFISEMEGRYLVKEPFSWEFQGNRMVQLYSVMKDLEVLS